MTLWTFCQSVLLVFNAFAILNEQRFLEKYGLGHSSLTSGYVSATSPRGQLIGLITATTYMRSACERRHSTAPSPLLPRTQKKKNFLSASARAHIPPPTPITPTAARPPFSASDATRRSLSLLRRAVPLVVINSLVIFVKMIFG